MTEMQWRYVYEGRVRHMFWTSKITDGTPAVCGLWPRGGYWFGTGSQREYEMAGENGLRNCLRCMALWLIEGKTPLCRPGLIPEYHEVPSEGDAIGCQWCYAVIRLAEANHHRGRRHGVWARGAGRVMPTQG